MLVNATEEFLNRADWLRDTNYAPVVAALRVLAQEIDAQPNASLFAEYGRTYRYANSLKPATPEFIDPLEALLTRDAYSA